MTVTFRVDGAEVTVSDAGASLLDALREELGFRCLKDGCSPQGQCGCCTVWVDGAPRAACVTAVGRVQGRDVTTTRGLPEADARRWADALVAAGGSQCGFCTPGIVMRLGALKARRGGGKQVDEAAIRKALVAHLCRCTGWQTIVEGAGAVLGVPVGPLEADGRPGGTEGLGPPAAVGGGRGRDPLLAAWRAQLEGPAFQISNPRTVLGTTGFADDTAPRDALVAVPGGDGSYVVAGGLADGRRLSGRVQGRNSPAGLGHPLEVAPGDWAFTLRTTWVEPAYLEPDASWCRPGGMASPLANGGAFGGKRRSPVPDAARLLAAERGRTVRVLWSREDVAQRGPKRPPMAAGVRLDGTGVVRVARTRGATGLDRWAERIRATAPGLSVEEVEVKGPPVSADLRGAGWAEAAVLAAVAQALSRGDAEPGTPVEISGAGGGRARVAVPAVGPVSVEVWAGEPLDEVVLRSYSIGAVHQALGWVRSEGVAVDEDGVVQDLTIRSYGVLAARDTPWVEVTVHEDSRWPSNGSDAVLAATAAAAWITDGVAEAWPTRTTRGGHR